MHLYIYIYCIYFCVPMCVYIYIHIGFCQWLHVHICAHVSWAMSRYWCHLVAVAPWQFGHIWALTSIYYIICIYIYIGVKSQDEDDDEYYYYYYHYYYDSPADRVFPLNVRHRKDQRQWLAQLAVARSIFQLINDSSPRLQQQKNNRSDDFLLLACKIHGLESDWN